MRYVFYKALLYLTGLSLGVASTLAEPARPVFEIHATTKPPVIDGKLDDSCWQDAPALTNFTQVLPIEGASPTERTEVRFLYDRDYLYIAVRCFDSEPEKIIAKQMQHDASFDSDDFVKIAFDTFFRQRDGYFFAVNPVGARTEGLIENFSEENGLWDTVWQARARIDAQGWTAEIAIPFKSLSFDPQRDAWGCNVERVIRRKQETVRWTVLSRAKDMTSLADFGELRGLQGMKQGLGLEVKPFISLRYHDDATTHDTGSKFKPGGDITYNITPSLKANATFNTDFAEADVDDRKVNLTRFPLFFPEKRDFFLQDSSLFRFGGLDESVLPYYSRRIGLSDNGQQVNLLAGGRLTGRIGDLSVALLDVQQDAYSISPTNRIQSKNLFVGRVSMLVLDESNVGMIFTHGDPLSNGDNTLAGFDFNYLNSHLPDDKTLVGHAWAMGSSSGSADGNDAAFGVSLEFPNEPLEADVSFRQIGKKFDPGLGFIERDGIRDYSGSVTYTWRPNTAWLRSISLGAEPSFTTDLDSRLVAEDHSVPVLTLSTPAGDKLTLKYNLVRDVVDESFDILPGIVIPCGNYFYSQFNPSFQSSAARPVSVGFQFSGGDFYTGTERDYKATLDWRPSRYVTAGLAYELDEIRLREGSFNVRIVSAKLNLSFTPDLSWNTIVQYDNVSSEAGLNSRVRWTYHPGSDLFLVANQGWNFNQWRFQQLTSELVLKVGATFRF
ncbi:MAG: DUF5916 domain-containing protein [Verrucomicrobiia bacterium]